MKTVVKEREIDIVWHFTKLENLHGILKYGLVPRERFENLLISNPEVTDIISRLVKFNDEFRFDGCKNANCCSIGHPNYKMFYSLRRSDLNQEWVVIAINPKILWERDCAFCVENAASSNVTNLSIAQRKGRAAFNKMFHDIQGKPTREELGISSDFPTNPQAEILVFDTIKPGDILGIVFQTEIKKEEYLKQYPNFDIICHSLPFKPRKDYRHWQ